MHVLWASDAEPDLNAHLSQWASFKLYGHLKGFGPCTSMGVFEGPNLIAVMVFHDYSKDRGVIEVSGVSEKPEWLKRHVLKEMFSYPFEELNCQLVVMRVSEKDKRLKRILTAYGFEGFEIPRLKGRHEAEIIYTLTDDAWYGNGFHVPRESAMAFTQPEVAGSNPAGQ